jgi:inner membrane protein
MPSAFTHIFVGEALAKTYTAEKMPVKFWVLAGVCSIIPDIDVIGFYYGVRYESLFGHRGFSHSLTFALLTAILVVSFAFPVVSRFSRKWWSLLAFFFAVTALHGVLDAMTSGGYGIAFFDPYYTRRFFLPWRPIVVSPIGIHGFFSRWGWDVIKSEMTWVWLPMTALLVGVVIFRKMKKSSLSS